MTDNESSVNIRGQDLVGEDAVIPLLVGKKNAAPTSSIISGSTVADSQWSKQISSYKF